MKVLGVTVASGTLYYGAVTVPDGRKHPEAACGAPERLVPSVGLAGAERLADTYQRITQDIRVTAPDIVILVGTRKHANWKYKEAFDRVSLISALQLSCAHEQVAFEEWTTERISKLVSVPAKSLSDFGPAELALTQRPKYWSPGRGAAFAAAVARVTESTGE